MNELAKEKTMTVKELSEIFSVSDKHIRETIKKLFPNKLENGKTTYLNEIEVTAIKLEIEKNPYLNQLVEVLPKTKLEKQMLIKQAMILQDEIISELQKEIEILKPKALFFDTVADSKTAIEMSQVAKVINMGYGRNELFEFLRNQKILMSNNIPYQKYIDLEYFRVIEQKYNKPDGSICINTKTLVYQKGIDFIIKLVKGFKS